MTATAPRYYYGLGRRKCAIARVRLYPGDGSIVVNGRQAAEYFGREKLTTAVTGPLRAVDALGRFSVVAKVLGGGVSGQADAVSLGISRALLVQIGRAHV